DANMLAASKGESCVLLDDKALLHGPTGAKVQGSVSAKLTGGGSSVEAGPAGVTASGPEVNASAKGIMTIAGAIVKINM
ncbi:hypothetical protein P6O78_15445, partial [Clostridium perfringens]|nr:hypothetical protein [Clostridium perfringens]